MSLKITGRATIWDVEDHGKYATVRMSTGRKDKRITEGNPWVNSNWSFVRFVGKAYEALEGASGKLMMRVEIVSAMISQEPYQDKEGQTAYPKSPTITVFEINVIEDGTAAVPVYDSGSSQMDEDDIPF